MVPKTEYMYKHINIIQASNTDIFQPILNIYIYRYVCIDIDVYCNLVLFFFWQRGSGGADSSVRGVTENRGGAEGNLQPITGYIT